VNPDPFLLVIEDDPADVLFLRRAFKTLGAERPLHVAENGREAIAYLEGRSPFDRRRAPTHVILDLKLPEKSGFEVLEWIRQRRDLRELPVAILTSSNESSDIRRARELKADGYFVKPMSFAALVEIVKAIDHWVRTGQAPSIAAKTDPDHFGAR
jgi:CheY-like chemotaxis protein